MYQLAVMRKGDDVKIVSRCCEDDFSKNKEYLEEGGYKSVEYFSTTDRALFYKTRCKAFVSELRNLVKNNSKYLEYLYQSNQDENVIAQVLRLQRGQEEYLINRVGRAYQVFLESNDGRYEYNDELVIDCYNYRNSKLRLHEHIAKELNRSEPYEC